jgi:hypothetical protein
MTLWFRLIAHLLVTLARLARPGGVRAVAAESLAVKHQLLIMKRSQRRRSYYRKLWIRCGNERGGVPFRVDHAKPGGSRVEGDATNAEGSGKRGFKGSQLGFV